MKRTGAFALVFFVWYNINMMKEKAFEGELKKSIDGYLKKNPVRMHMPGHKGRYRREYRRDITELSFSDNLSNPSGVIKRLGENIASVYDAKKTFLLVNGSTSGIISSIMYSAGKGDKIILPRNSHVSAYHALFLSESDPCYIYPADSVRGPLEEAYVRAVRENPDAKAVLITYPSYYGYAIDIKKTVEKIRQISEDMIVIVDQAHGAHFKFSDSYPLCATDSGADLVVMSMHKTLVSPNQTALLHVMSDRIDDTRLSQYVKMMTTTSPSYVFLTAMEDAVIEMAELGEERLEFLKECYMSFKRKTENRTGISVTEFDQKNHDWLKLVLGTERLSIDGKGLSEILERDYSIYTEASMGEYVLCYLGTGTERSDMDALYEAVYRIGKQYVSEGGSDEKNIKIIKLKKAMSIRDAIEADYDYLPLEEAAGKVSAFNIVAYPPGYPVIAAGETISAEAVDFLRSVMKDSEVIGIDDGMVRTVRE